MPPHLWTLLCRPTLQNVHCIMLFSSGITIAMNNCETICAMGMLVSSLIIGIVSIKKQAVQLTKAIPPEIHKQIDYTSVIHRPCRLQYA